jgi:hypothetical protein
MRFKENLTSMCREMNKKEIVPSYASDKTSSFVVRWLDFCDHEHGYANNNEGGLFDWITALNRPKSLICYETFVMASTNISLSL